MRRQTLVNSRQKWYLWYSIPIFRSRSQPLLACVSTAARGGVEQNNDAHEKLHNVQYISDKSCLDAECGCCSQRQDKEAYNEIQIPYIIDHVYCSANVDRQIVKKSLPNESSVEVIHNLCVKIKSLGGRT